MTISENLRRDEKKRSRKLASNATDEFKICDDAKKRWCELVIDKFLTKMIRTDKKVQKKYPPITVSITLSSTPFLDNLKNLFPNKLKADESSSGAYSLGKTMRNKKGLNDKETASSIDTNGDITYGTGTVECDC